MYWSVENGRKRSHVHCPIAFVDIVNSVQHFNYCLSKVFFFEIRPYFPDKDSQQLRGFSLTCTLVCSGFMWQIMIHWSTHSILLFILSHVPWKDLLHSAQLLHSEHSTQCTHCTSSPSPSPSSSMLTCVIKGLATSLWTSSSKRSRQASIRKAKGGKRWWTCKSKPYCEVERNLLKVKPKKFNESDNEEMSFTRSAAFGSRMWVFNLPWWFYSQVTHNAADADDDEGHVWWWWSRRGTVNIDVEMDGCDAECNEKGQVGLWKYVI